MQMGLLDEELLERSEAGIATDERIEKDGGALGGKHVQSQLPVGRAAPSVLVLGSVINPFIVEGQVRGGVVQGLAVRSSSTSSTTPTGSCATP